MQDSFIGRNQVVPVFDDQFLPVFGAIAVSSDVLVEEMRVGNNPGILGNGECVIESHPLIIFGDLHFSLPGLAEERPGSMFLPGRSCRV